MWETVSERGEGPQVRKHKLAHCEIHLHPVESTYMPPLFYYQISGLRGSLALNDTVELQLPLANEINPCLNKYLFVCPSSKSPPAACWHLLGFCRCAAARLKIFTEQRIEHHLWRPITQPRPMTLRHLWGVEVHKRPPPSLLPFPVLSRFFFPPSKKGSWCLRSHGEGLL